MSGKLDLSSPKAVDQARDIIVRLLMQEGKPMRFRDLLCHFSDVDNFAFIVVCNVLTKALYKLQKDGVVKKNIDKFKRGIYFELTKKPSLDDFPDYSMLRWFLVCVTAAVTWIVLKANW